MRIPDLEYLIDEEEHNHVEYKRTLISENTYMMLMSIVSLVLMSAVITSAFHWI